MMDLAEALSLVTSRQQDYTFLRAYVTGICPNTMKALSIIDKDYTEPKKRKGFNLVKRENKKRGFAYYVRYSHEGKMLPSKWNTHTNTLEEAERYALKNKERLVQKYLHANDIRMYAFLETFFKERSVCLVSEEKRNRPLSDKNRRNFNSVINNKLVPFLREQKITGFDTITVKILSDFQDRLLKDLKPQTINSNLTAVRMVFHYLERKGMIKENPCAMLAYIPVHEHDKEAHGCYDIEKLKGVFSDPWENKNWYLLCLLIYTTGMRNSEIRKIRISDVTVIEGCHFIDIKESKTKSGIRLVPLHDFVYQKLAEYAAERSGGAPLFRRYCPTDFTAAAMALAVKLGITEEEAKAQNITFYSGRHFWKTLMNSEGLGDVEELFMGHRVSSNVAKLYNHRDKQGKKSIVK